MRGCQKRKIPKDPAGETSSEARSRRQKCSGKREPEKLLLGEDSGWRPETPGDPRSHSKRCCAHFVWYLKHHTQMLLPAHLKSCQACGFWCVKALLRRCLCHKLPKFSTNTDRHEYVRYGGFRTPRAPPHASGEGRSHLFSAHGSHGKRMVMSNY